MYKFNKCMLFSDTKTVHEAILFFDTKPLWIYHTHTQRETIESISKWKWLFLLTKFNAPLFLKPFKTITTNAYF